ncbi:MAG: hypothetical protein HYV66_00675 [Candidatus Sungbacteria bacterium]|uniref:Uncharacterized protein n=1 Tax=Candidatus Sungiibacteriota bacterium TaxID=2750080 RepID=A0A931YD86_9BACT|nr:hypothetical protein [Candidatus Sungbacteria bacterium]
MRISPDSLTRALILSLVLLIYALFLAHPTNLVTADLGRHIENGRLILDGRLEVLKTNFYSYTYPDFPAANHHWLGGAVFYLVWKFFGFMGLHLFFIVLSLAALFIFFLIAQSRAGPGLAGLLSVFIIPLLLERDEVRPEVFSYLLAGIFLGLMLKYRAGEISWKKLLILPVLEFFWVNLHIYFFLGPVVIGVFLLENLILKTKKSLGYLAVVFSATILATLINPYGLEGTLAPFSIFQNFGYPLAENQTVWFIEKIIPNPNYFIFKIVFAILALSFIFSQLKNRRGLNIPDMVLATGFSLAGWLAIRNFAVFGLFALPIAAGNLAKTFNIKTKTNDWLNRTAAATLALAALIALSGELRAFYPKSPGLGLGLENGNARPLEFFKENNLAGPIFNNYDIGGYLIYGLFPQEKVYVDNRPEAYPAEFFTQTYIPMQEDEDAWIAASEKYKFNAIIFSYRDYTPWGQTFFRRILEDPGWKTVFADSRVVILLKDNELNKDIIAKYGKSIKIKR